MPKYVLPSGGGSQIRGGRRYSHFAPLVSSRMSSDPNVQGGFSSECDCGVSRGEDEDNSSEEEGQFKNVSYLTYIISVTLNNEFDTLQRSFFHAQATEVN